VFQGMLLFFVLSCDTLIHYRIRLVFAGSQASEAKA
jgi:simple sugar transport system permease protein